MTMNPLLAFFNLILSAITRAAERRRVERRRAKQDRRHRAAMRKIRQLRASLAARDHLVDIDDNPYDEEEED
jgi:hypothetical protein